MTSNDAEQTRYVRALAERVPACFFTVRSNGGHASAFPHHHAKFDIDERALETGVRTMTALALDVPDARPKA